jgi:hypothetical protein
MKYTTSGIICLANDLRETALLLQEKREIADDLRKRINGVDQTASAVAFYPNVPVVNWFSNSRLIVVGHGNPESTHMIGDGMQWEPKQLAEEVNKWLNGLVIKRISLHMCFGGGNRGAGAGTNFDAFTVHPTQSFAYKFASLCGNSETITARTERTNMHEVRADAALTKAYRMVGEPGKKQHKGLGDKVFFVTQGGSPDNPIKPKMQYFE